MTSKRPLITFLLVAIILIGAGVAAYITFIRIPTELATKTADAVKQAFHVTPQVKISQTIVIEQSAPIMEFATVARQLMVDYAWSHTWLGSTKTIHLQAVFTAKAGVDLREPFSLTIKEHPLRVDALIPPPKILSLTMDSYRVLQDENGWWNKISNADRDSAMMELQATAMAQAVSSGMLDEVRSSMQDRIKDIVQKNGATVEFVSRPG